MCYHYTIRPFVRTIVHWLLLNTFESGSFLVHFFHLLFEGCIRTVDQVPDIWRRAVVSNILWVMKWMFSAVWVERKYPIGIPGECVATVSEECFITAPNAPGEVARHMHSFSENQGSQGWRYSITKQIFKRMCANRCNACRDFMFVVCFVDRFVQVRLV